MLLYCVSQGHVSHVRSLLYRISRASEIITAVPAAWA